MLKRSKHLSALRRHQVSRNAFWVLLGQGINFLIQAGYFVLLARLLGVREYGVFAGAFALVNLLTPYSALGAGMLFMRYITADRSKANAYWGNSLALTTGASVAIAASLFFLGPLLTHIHARGVFVALAFANCLFAQITSLASLVFQTFEKMRWTALLSTASSAARLIILLILYFGMHHVTAVGWSIGVLAASGCSAALALALVRSEIGSVAFEPTLIVQRLREGIGFSFAGTTQAAYNDVDKVMLSHYGLNAQNGFYTLAYRVIDVATTPVAALDAALLPRFFQKGRISLSTVVELTIKSMAISALAGIAIASAVLFLAPLIPRLVGHDFSGVLLALRWLAWIPLLRGLHRATGSALTGSGMQHLRTAAQLTVALANFLFNLWWIPAHGWIGAAWSSVASDGLLVVLNSVMLLCAWKRTIARGALALAESKAF